MPQLITYNVFISHAWDYGDEYDRFVSLLDNAPNFSWRNYSIPEDDPVHNGGNTQQLLAAFERQMRPAHIVVALSGVYASHSDMMQREFGLARRLGKPLVGVEPFGSLRTSQAVRDAADEMVAWSTVSIVAAIRRHSR